MVYIDPVKCNLCGVCVDMCPYHAIELSGSLIRVDTAACTDCKSCVSCCPTGAIM